MKTSARLRAEREPESGEAIRDPCEGIMWFISPPSVVRRRNSGAPSTREIEATRTASSKPSPSTRLGVEHDERPGLVRVDVAADHQLRLRADERQDLPQVVATDVVAEEGIAPSASPSRPRDRGDAAGNGSRLCTNG